MKRYTITIKVDVFAPTDGIAITKAEIINNNIQRKFNPTSNIHSVAESRFFGLNNRYINLKK